MILLNSLGRKIDGWWVCNCRYNWYFTGGSKEIIRSFLFHIKHIHVCIDPTFDIHETFSHSATMVKLSILQAFIVVTFCSEMGA